jgi:hypothetical protein
MIQEDIYTLLANDAGVGALTSRIYPISGPQETAFPVIVYARINSRRDTNFDEVEDFVRSTFMIDSYSETYAESAALSEAVRAAINNHTSTSIHLIKLDSANDIFESETDLFRVSQNYEIWHTET